MRFVLLFAVVVFLDQTEFCVSILFNIPFKRGEYLRLGQYNISKEITVSGISGGGGFSKLIAFVFSSIVRGVGMFTAGPFPVGIVAVDNTANMLNASHYIAWIDYLSSRGFIDDTRYLRKLRVYFHHGMADYIAPPFLSRLGLAIFKHYKVEKIRDMISKVPSTHCVPTERYIVPCAIFINGVCGCGYNAVYDMFRTFFPGFIHPKVEITASASGHLFKFDQNEFFPSNMAKHYFWNNYGWAYVPRRCEPETGIKCRLHFAFPGCTNSLLETNLNIPPEWIRATGYFEAADANDIIIISPYTQIDLHSSLLSAFDCYDFYGATSAFRITSSTKFGIQPQAVKKIYERILLGI